DREEDVDLETTTHLGRELRERAAPEIEERRLDPDLRLDPAASHNLTRLRVFKDEHVDLAARRRGLGGEARDRSLDSAGHRFLTERQACEPGPSQAGELF